MAFGITADGFNKKTLADISGETETELRDELGSEIQLDDRDPLGNIKAVLDERESLIWDALEAIYNNISNVDAAEGIALDNAVAINGITRLAATKGTVTITIAGTPATVVPAGFQVAKVDEQEVVVSLLEDATIAVSGTVDADFEFVDEGFISAPAGTLTVIVSPVAGVDSVTNAEAAIPGRDLESDADLKTRRTEDLESGDGCSDNGIRDALQNNVEGVSDAFVESNRTMFTDSNGRPAKSFEAFVLGGTDGDIAAEILRVQPAGIESYGTESVDIDDDEGVEQNVKFSRISEREFECRVTITPNEDEAEGPLYPSDGDDLVKQSIVDYFDSLSAGSDIVNNQAYTFINTVNGVIGISLTFRVKGSGDPFVSTNISVPRQFIPVIDADDVAVTS